MSIGFSGVQTDVTISGAVTAFIGAPAQPLVQYNEHSFAGAGNFTVYTVPAGKKAYITGISAANGAAGAGNLAIGFNIAAVNPADTETANSVGVAIWSSATYTPNYNHINLSSSALVGTAGQALKCYAEGACYARIQVWGYLESV